MLDQVPIINELPPGTRELVMRLLLLALVILLAAVLRRVVTWILMRPLRQLAKRTTANHDDMMLDAARNPIRWVVFGVAILIAQSIFEVGDSLDAFIINLGRTMIIIGLLLFVFKLVDLFAPNSRNVYMLTGMKVEERLLPFIRTGIKLVVIALGIVIVLQEWNYDVTGLIAGLGVGALAVSLAAQDTLSNLFGFGAIVSDNPFSVGEYIKTPDVEGVVEHVGLRSTRIRQLDQAVVYVPNSKLANSAILNWSRLTKRRLNFVLGVTYDSTSGDLRVLLHRIREMLSAQESIDPETVTVYFIEFGGSSLDLLVRAYVMIADWTEFTAEVERLKLEVLDIVDDLSMSIAFPSTSLYVETLPAIRSEGEQPRLSAHEQALMRGDVHEEVKPQQPGGESDENVTGQQDEAND